MIIEYTKAAVKSIKATDKPTRQRINQAICKLPADDIKKLKGYTALFRLRVGDLRVLLEMHTDKIIIIDVLPRGEAYKGL